MSCSKLIAINLLLVFAVSLATAQPSPQTPPTNLAEAFERQIMSAEKNVVDAADAMPADKYDFAPSEKLGDFKGVRTFGEQVRHIAAANYLFGSALLGEKPPFPVDPKNVNGPDSNKTKEQIMKFLRDSYAVAHRAMTKINDSNKLELVESPFGNKLTRFGMSNILVWHPYDHYGQMVVYLRMNGIVPPASRQN
jgi:uncharacterized damage-inducible protein DinB